MNTKLMEFHCKIARVSQFHNSLGLIFFYEFISSFHLEYSFTVKKHSFLASDGFEAHGHGGFVDGRSFCSNFTIENRC